MQCTLTLRHGRLIIRDTSTNGTYVNGREVGRDEIVELHEGSLVTLLVPSIGERDDEFGLTIPVRPPVSSIWPCPPSVSILIASSPRP